MLKLKLWTRESAASWQYSYEVYVLQDEHKVPIAELEVRLQTNCELVSETQDNSIIIHCLKHDSRILRIFSVISFESCKFRSVFHSWHFSLSVILKE